MTERISAIDALRGFALLGILIMNITVFSMPSIAYLSPVAFEGTPFNQVVYGASHVFADQKFMALFSMLFGASVLLFVNSALRKGKAAWRLFFVRNGWLLVIGLLHSAYLWHGDVLFVYAICSFFLYFLKNLSPKNQLVGGVAIYAFPILFNVFLHQAVVDELPAVEQKDLAAKWNPPVAAFDQEIKAYRGSYAQQNAYRAAMWSNVDDGTQAGAVAEAVDAIGLLVDAFSRAFGMMLIGMACFKWGVFSNALKAETYQKMIRYGFGVGLPLSLMGLGLSYHFEWHWRYAQFLGRIPNSIATPFITFGYIGAVMLWLRGETHMGLKHRLKAIGKLALTAYILQSVLATLVFYGFGLGLFGHLNRFSNVCVMFAIWIVILLFGSAWLSRFQYGPLEWVWRCLTYFRIMPLLPKKPLDSG